MQRKPSLHTRRTYVNLKQKKVHNFTNSCTNSVQWNARMSQKLLWFWFILADHEIRTRQKVRSILELQVHFSYLGSDNAQNNVQIKLHHLLSSLTNLPQLLHHNCVYIKISTGFRAQCSLSSLVKQPLILNANNIATTALQNRTENIRNIHLISQYLSLIHRQSIYILMYV